MWEDLELFRVLLLHSWLFRLLLVCFSVASFRLPIYRVADDRQME